MGSHSTGRENSHLHDLDVVVDFRAAEVDSDTRPVSIPFLDLGAQHRQLEQQIVEAWRAILRDGSFIGGRAVEAFEDELAAYLGVQHAVGVGNGTDAIMLALRALGLEPGDEVIAPANTYVATIEAIVHAGGKPVLVDVDPKTASVDPDAIESAITGRTRFIVPVHLYGQPADMERILAVATRHQLRVVEDNAQALGARYHGRPTGTLGDAAALSFYPAKNLGAVGDGGAVVTDDPAVAERVRILANHGQPSKNEHVEVGYNSRLDALQASALRIKLPYLDTWNERRRQIASLYEVLLSDSAITTPVAAPGRDHVYHLYVVRHPERQALADALAGSRIGTGLHYPTPIHLMKPFWDLGEGPDTYPIAESWADTLFSLPIGPQMTDEQVTATAVALDQALGGLDVLERHPV